MFRLSQLRDENKRLKHSIEYERQRLIEQQRSLSEKNEVHMVSVVTYACVHDVAK